MTDLERAHLFIQEHFDCQDVICTFAKGCGCAAQLSDLVAAARREGAEQAGGEIRALRKALHDETMKRLASAEAMRERAAKTAESDDWSDVYGWNPVALHIADAIRALPLTPEEPA